MHANDHTLRHLAARVSAGDLGAVAELREEIQPHLRRIARRALRPTSTASALTRRGRAAAAILSQDEPGCPAPDAEELATPVADNLCESFLLRVQAGGVVPMMETVCG